MYVNQKVNNLPTYFPTSHSSIVLTIGPANRPVTIFFNSTHSRSPLIPLFKGKLKHQLNFYAYFNNLSSRQHFS